MMLRLAAIAARIACLAAAVTVLPATSTAQTTVTMLVGYPPGGATDLMARILQPELAAALGGSQVVVKNVPGANGTVGALELPAPARTAPPSCSRPAARWCSPRTPAAPPSAKPTSRRSARSPPRSW